MAHGVEGLGAQGCRSIMQSESMSLLGQNRCRGLGPRQPKGAHVVGPQACRKFSPPELQAPRRKPARGK